MNYWLLAFVLMTGFSMGVVASVKWIAPPKDDIDIETKFGKLKIKSRKNSPVSDVLDVNDIVDLAIQEAEGKKLTLRERIEQRRSERKAKK